MFAAVSVFAESVRVVILLLLKRLSGHGLWKAAA
jgi:hypothetical protein